MIVHVMGFRRSGSSAMVDALVDQGSAIGISGGYPDETALFSPGRPHSPLRYFSLYPGNLDLAGLCALVTEGRVGLDESDFAEEIGVFISSGVAVNRSVNNGNFPGLTLGKFIQVANDFPDLLKQISIGDLEMYVDFVGALVRTSFDKNVTLVFNNDPPAHHFWGNNIVRGSIVIPVGRNSADVIADRLERDRVRNELGRQQGWARLLFIFLSGFRLIRVGKRLEGMQIPVVSFERLVISPFWRDAFFSDIGVFYNVEKEVRFLSEEALEQIGAHRGRLSLKDRAVLRLGETLALFFPPPSVRRDFSIRKRKALRMR